MSDPDEYDDDPVTELVDAMAEAGAAANENEQLRDRIADLSAQVSRARQQAAEARTRIDELRDTLAKVRAWCDRIRTTGGSSEAIWASIAVRRILDQDGE